MTRAAFDLVSAFACLRATALPGPVFAAVLAHRGYSVQNVRNQLVRLVDRGLLERTRSGRTTVYRRSPALDASFRVYSGKPPARAFAGHFEAVVVTIPESRRGDRDRVTHIAGHCGYRALRPGVLISVRDERAQLLSRLVRALPDLGGVEPCRIVPESPEQARRWALRTFTSGDESAELSRLQNRMAALAANGRPAHPAYFDVFYAAAMLAERSEVLPDQLCDPERNTGLQGQRLLTDLARLWDEGCLQPLVREVTALDAGRLIEWEAGPPRSLT